MRPIHYAIRSLHLNSSVIEISLDGEFWAKIDWKTDTGGLHAFPLAEAPFAPSQSGECRFTRLTQTAKNHSGNDHLAIGAFEFFETLLE
jgi:hypothetical protein